MHPAPWPLAFSLGDDVGLPTAQFNGRWWGVAYELTFFHFPVFLEVITAL